MKSKIIIRYTLEFVVIVMGISQSFYIEKTNLNLYNEKLKNISLEKIYDIKGAGLHTILII